MALLQKKKIFQKDEIINKEGDMSFDWYVLVKGRVGVYKGDLKMNEFSERGVIFGELSGLLARPRTATMKALEESEVMVVESSIDEVIRNHPDIANKILISLAERLAKTTDEMWAVIEDKENKK
ncbi:MAG: cyclic nucleotide-binding domain-containing protein [Bacteroidota bacterium]